MTKPTNIALALGFVAGLVVSIPSARADNRPAELGLFSMLNGEQSRSTQSDGGGLAMFTADAGIGCASVPTGGVYEIHCNASGHFCPWGSDGGSAFCSSTIGLNTYGRPVNSSTPDAPYPFFYTAPAGTAGSTKSICVTPKSGSASMTCAVFKMN